MEHGAWFYLLSWAATLILALGALRFLIDSPIFRLPVERRESGRGSYLPRFFRLGGAALIVTFLIMISVDTRLTFDAALTAFAIGTLSILFFSFTDDFFPVPWPWHLLLQGGLGFLVFSAGMQIDLANYFGTAVVHPFIGLLAVIAWMVIVMNAVNWSDGTDGLMPGVAALSFATIFVLSLRPEVNQPAVGILSIILLALALALLFFNWHPAKILAGTGGAYFFGFALATLAIYSGTKVATTLLVLAIPVFDACSVCFRRFRAGRSLFQPDRAHLHHQLLEAGWGPERIALSYLALTAAMAVLALSLEDTGKVATFLGAGILLGGASIALSVWLSLNKKRI